MHIGSAALVLIALAACIPARPEFPEPSWGEAPPPRIEEVVEITIKKIVCVRHQGCTAATTILHRGGGATQEFTTDDTHDSTLVSSIDSVEFATLAGRLVEEHFFGPDMSSTAHQDWGRSEDWVISASARGLRKVEHHPGTVLSVSPVPGYSPIRHSLMVSLDSAQRSLRWTVPK